LPKSSVDGPNPDIQTEDKKKVVGRSDQHIEEVVRRERRQRSRLPPQKPSTREVRAVIAEAAEAGVNITIRQQQGGTLPLIGRI